MFGLGGRGEAVYDFFRKDLCTGKRKKEAAAARQVLYNRLIKTGNKGLPRH